MYSPEYLLERLIYIFQNKQLEKSAWGRSWLWGTSEWEKLFCLIDLLFSSLQYINKRLNADSWRQKGTIKCECRLELQISEHCSANATFTCLHTCQCPAHKYLRNLPNWTTFEGWKPEIWGPSKIPWIQIYFVLVVETISQDKKKVMFRVEIWNYPIII